MNKKLTIKRICKIAALLLAVAVCTLLFQDLLLSCSKSNRGRIKGFYLEKKDTVDVVFIGASEVYCDFAPTYAYGKYGFTSYPFVTQGSTIRNYLTAVKEAVRTQHPKLLVIEINGALYDEPHLNKEAYARYFIDNMPMNKNKVEFIENRVTENKLEYYLPFIKYHGNWSELPHDLLYAVSVPADSLRGYTMLKGAKTKTMVHAFSREELYNLRPGVENERSDLLEDCRTELIALLEYCREQDLQVLFVRFPHAVLEKEAVRFGRACTAGDIIREYGYPFVNFDLMLDELGIDAETDFYNAEHLNIYGQKKFTEYLSEYMMEHFGIRPSELDKKTRDEWDRCAAYYDDYAALGRLLMEKGIRVSLGDDIASYLAVRNFEKYSQYVD